jgi:hypothetical protein
MKYFTRDRYLAMQNEQDEAMDAADADWEAAAGAYDAQLQTIRPAMPESGRQLLDGFYLHDARVLSMGQRGDSFVISLQLNVPPNDLLTITYRLAGPVDVKKDVFSWVKNAYVADWLYDEVELIQEGEKKHFVHSILLSSGWEIELPFTDVQTTTAFPLLPHPRSATTDGPPMPVPQSA